MADLQIEVEDQELAEVLRWAQQHRLEGTTEHEEGTYEEGVSDCICWLLGAISTRPDQP